MGKLSRETPPPREGEPMGATVGGGTTRGDACIEKLSKSKIEDVVLHPVYGVFLLFFFYR